MTLDTVWFIVVAYLLDRLLHSRGLRLRCRRPPHGRGPHRGRASRAVNAIGPFWDGNEVWLVVAGASMFAAFPWWYATMFSALYLALLIVLVALIGRGLSFEFRTSSLPPAGGTRGAGPSPSAAPSCRSSSAWGWVICCTASPSTATTTRGASGICSPRSACGRAPPCSCSRSCRGRASWPQDDGLGAGPVHRVSRWAVGARCGGRGSLTWVPSGWHGGVPDPFGVLAVLAATGRCGRRVSGRLGLHRGHRRHGCHRRLHLHRPLPRHGVQHQPRLQPDRHQPASRRTP